MTTLKRKHHHLEILALAAVLMAAGALRFWALGNLPPGLYRDEAYNGLDGLGILRGDLALYFEANNGREPMFFYLIAASVGALGRTPLAVRLPSAFASLLTVPALYLMARALWNQRVGLLSAAALAVTLWPVHLAHVSFRAVLLPLFLALGAWQAARGWQSSHRRHWLAAGALYGLSFYTYLAARFTPLILALFALYAWIVFLRHTTDARRRAFQGAAWFMAAAALAALPFLLYTCFHWDIVMGRVGQASVFNPAIHKGNLAGALIGNTLRALGMFFVQGDRIYRHNVPWRPVFDPVMGAFFAAGAILAARRLKQDAASALALCWTLVMLLPTILAEDSPHFLRAVGVLPVIAVFPALAWDALQNTGFSKKAGAWAIAGALLFSLSSTAYDYVARYPQDPKTAYWFDSAGVSMARDINAALNSGARVMVDRRLWDDWVNARFLVPQNRITLLETNQASPMIFESILWLAWPYDDWARIWPALPPRAQIEAREGALSQGDLDPEPYTAYISFRAEPYVTLPSPRARFEQGIQLLQAHAAPVDGRLRVQLEWYAEAAPLTPFTVFVHLLQNGQRVAQGDAPPASGYYPTQAWRAGDVIVDEHWVDWTNFDGSEQVIIGLYLPEADKRLNVLDAAGQPIADSILLDIERK